jgi:DNA-binding CsgD family transcriptional regulator
MTVSVCTTKHISFQSIDQMQMICEPLFSHLPVKIFEYSRFYPNGMRCELCTHAEHLENAFVKAKNMVGVYTPSFVPTNTRIIIVEDWIETIPAQSRQRISEQLVSQRSLFNIGNELVISQINDNYHEYFHFYCDAKDRSVLNILLGAMPLLEHFILYFLNEAHDLIQASIEQPLVQPWKTPPGKPSGERDLQLPKKADFLAATQIKRFYLPNADDSDYLSERELACAKLLVHGMTAKEIALSLEISPRTVEVHINSIKDKLGCTWKSEVARQLIKLGINKVL